MVLKITRVTSHGGVNSASQGSSKAVGGQDARSQVSNSNSSATRLGSEAVVSSLGRATKSPASGEPIENDRKAREVADKVAEKIRDGDRESAEETHAGLDSGSVTGHVVVQ